MKKTTLFFICGFVATSLANHVISSTNQQLGGTQFNQNNAASAVVNQGLQGSPFLGALSQAESQVSSVQTLKGIAGEPNFDCLETSQPLHGFEKDCCACGFENDWGCLCNQNKFDIKPTSSVATTHVVAASQQAIPAQFLSTTLDEVTNQCQAQNSTAARNVRIDTDFHVCGNLQTKRFDCLQEVRKENEDFEEAGSGYTNFAESQSDHDCECDCHPIESKNRGNFKTDCNCEQCCNIGFEHVDDIDKDIEKRVSHSVEAAISEILSEAVNRCISTSLNKCIQLH